tara:strand:- start:121 stop:588 length:468 start_codon:yes stop_codon:yes gene_type:complete
MKRISKHISYKESIYSDTAKRRGIINKPKKEHIENMELIAEKVFEPLREFVGHPIKINSMFRSKDLNTAIGGSKTSSHMDGSAIDLTSIGGKSNLEMFHYIKDNLEFDQLIWEFGVEEPKWIHVSYINRKHKKKQVLVCRKKGRFVTWDGCVGCK